jgi:hypothetical protein
VQPTRRWLIISDSWSHIGQRSGWGRLRCAKRSAVQQLSWATSHKKKEHLAGAQHLGIRYWVSYLLSWVHLLASERALFHCWFVTPAYEQKLHGWY